MTLRIIQFGKTKDRWLQEGIDEYLKRLAPFVRIDTRELPDCSIKNTSGPDEVRASEAASCLKQIAGEDYVVLLNEQGAPKTSLEFSAFLNKLSTVKTLVFVIGGVYGTGPSLNDRADATLSLSPMTFTHRMTRLILVEQIYRAMMINSGRSYHV
jgi:23S rRNA (pseudouridine1915-N3)-methyltransferase